MKLVEYKRGEALAIQFMDCGDKKYDVLAFLDSLRRSGNKDYFQLIALLDRTAKHGVVWNEYKTKRFKGSAAPLCEFKARGGARLIWFYDEQEKSLIICTHGFVKKRDDTPGAEIVRAQERRNIYYQAKN